MAVCYVSWVFLVRCWEKMSLKNQKKWLEEKSGFLGMYFLANALKKQQLKETMGTV